MVIAVDYHLMNRIDDVQRSVRKLPPVIAMLVSCALFLATMPPANAVSVGPFSPSNCNDVGGGDVVWNPTNNLTSNAKLDGTAGQPNSNNMLCTGYGFTVPAVATIVGIIVTLDRKAKKDNQVVDLRVRLVKGGVMGVTDRSTGTYWPKEAALEDHGGPADLWGDTWTPADINAGNFGAVVAAQAPSDKVQADLRDLTITVSYTFECGIIPNAYPLYAAVGLDPGNNGTINGINITGTGNALQTSGALTTVSQTLPGIVPDTFPLNSSTTKINTNSVNPVAAGNYDSVTLGAAISVFSGGTYNIKTLTAKKNKTVQLAPGDYFVDTLKFDDSSRVVIFPAGDVRIFINTRLDIDKKATLNAAGATENLQIFLYSGAQAKFDDDIVFNGLIYGEGATTTIDFKDDATLTGAIISDGSLSFDDNLVLNYSAATQAAVASITTCEDVDNFLIDIGAPAASTCAPKNITITARDINNNTVVDYAGTVSISTSSNHGDWTLTAGFGGTLNNLAPDDGAATYLYAAADNGVVTLSLSNTHADDLTVTVVDPTAPSSLSISAFINFRDNVFVITPTDSLGTTAVAGRNHALRAELWDRDLATGNCLIVTSYTGPKNLDAWNVADIDHPAGANVPTISSGIPPGICGGAPSLALGAVVPAPNPASNNLLSVPFVNGVWDFCLSTSDVGKYAISLRDDTRVHATGVDIGGASNTLTVRPFGLAITGVQKGATVNPAGTATAGSRFVPAGNSAQPAATFEVTVGGYLWNVADDGNNDGGPDGGANITNNGLAPRFASLTTLSAANTAPYFTPIGGALGTLTGTTSVAMGAYAGGQVTVSDLAYSEVGSFQMQADVTNYLNSAGADISGVNVDAGGLPTQIGRFYPDYFTLLPANSVTAACVSGGFTYMGQPGLGVVFTVEARNTAGVRTNNYGVGYSVGSVNVVAENNDDGVDLSTRLTVPVATWALGAYIINTGAANFSRAAALDGPYESLQLGVDVVDADLALLVARDMNPVTVGACGGACTAKALTGTTKQRFGRLRMDNLSGTARLALPLRIQAQYYTANGFVTNGDDGCTSFTSSDIAMAFVVGTNLSACETGVIPNGPVTLAGGKVSGLQLAAPGAAVGNDGSVNLTLNLGAASGNTCTAVGPPSAATSAGLDHLQGNWGGTATWDQNPGARATFGVYKDAAEILYLQENY